MRPRVFEAQARKVLGLADWSLLIGFRGEKASGLVQDFGVTFWICAYLPGLWSVLLRIGGEVFNVQGSGFLVKGVSFRVWGGSDVSHILLIPCSQDSC